MFKLKKHFTLKISEALSPSVVLWFSSHGPEQHHCFNPSPFQLFPTINKLELFKEANIQGLAVILLFREILLAAFMTS